MLSNCIVLFQTMGNTQTTYSLDALVDVLTHQSNLRSDDAKIWGDNMRACVYEQKRLHSTVDLLPDQLTDVTILVLTLLCVVLSVVVVQLHKKLSVLETLSTTDSTLVKHRLLGLHMENLQQIDNTRCSLREMLRDSDPQQV